MCILSIDLENSKFEQYVKNMSLKIFESKEEFISTHKDIFIKCNKDDFFEIIVKYYDTEKMIDIYKKSKDILFLNIYVYFCNFTGNHKKVTELFKFIDLNKFSDWHLVYNTLIAHNRNKDFERTVELSKKRKGFLMIVERALALHKLGRYKEELALYNEISKHKLNSKEKMILDFRYAEYFFKINDKKSLFNVVNKIENYYMEIGEDLNTTSYKLSKYFSFLGDDTKQYFYLKKAASLNFNMDGEIYYKNKASRMLHEKFNIVLEEI